MSITVGPLACALKMPFIGLIADIGLVGETKEGESR
jgi:hypothetical protein